MNAAVVESYSNPPRYISFPDPVAQEEARIVRVTAAGLHPIVKSLANGNHYGSTGKFPFVVGVDGTGVLEDGTEAFLEPAGRPSEPLPADGGA